MPEAQAKPRKPRGVRRASATLEAEGQVLCRLPLSLIAQLDETAKQLGLSRTKTAEKAIAAALGSAQLLPAGDLPALVSQHIGDILADAAFQDRIRAAVADSLGNKLHFVAREIAETKNALQTLATVVAKKM